MNTMEQETANPFILFLILILLLAGTGNLGNTPEKSGDKVFPAVPVFRYPTMQSRHKMLQQK